MVQHTFAGATLVRLGLVFGLTLLGACGDDSVTEFPDPVGKPGIAPDAVVHVENAGRAEETPASGDGEPEWQISVEGQPVLSGKRVMATQIGDLRMLTLVGADAMVSFNLRGAAPAEPYSAQIGYLDTQLHCARGAGDSPTGEVLLSAEGERILVSGTIGCRPPEGEREQRAITGWFPRPQSP